MKKISSIIIVFMLVVAEGLSSGMGATPACTKSRDINVGGTVVTVSVTAETCREARKALREMAKKLKQ